MRSAPRLALLALLVTGCGYGHLQTARTTPRGALDTTVGVGFLYNDTIKTRKEQEGPDGGSGVSVTNLPLIINSRLGVHDRVDVGLRLFMLAGAAADAKVNLLDPKSRWALSVSAGLGAARDLGSKKGYLVNLPVTLHASYDVSSIFTPYVAVGYSFFWIYGRDVATPDDGYYSERAGYGDQLFTLAAGIRLKISRRTDVFFEYDLWQPVVDDPGDFFSFRTSHFMLVGLRFRGRLFGGSRYDPPPAAHPPYPVEPQPLPGALPPPPPDRSPAPPPPPPPPPTAR